MIIFWLMVNFCISRDCNNSIMEMLIMAYACKTSTARRVVGVIPYLSYSQQCKKLAQCKLNHVCLLISCTLPVTCLILDLLISIASKHILTAGLVFGFCRYSSILTHYKVDLIWPIMKRGIMHIWIEAMSFAFHTSLYLPGFGPLVSYTIHILC